MRAIELIWRSPRNFQHFWILVDFSSQLAPSLGALYTTAKKYHFIYSQKLWKRAIITHCLDWNVQVILSVPLNLAQQSQFKKMKFWKKNKVNQKVTTQSFKWKNPQISSPSSMKIRCKGVELLVNTEVRSEII